MTLARWLALAASPGFALMVVANLVEADAAPSPLCPANGVSWLGGMATMYALMCLVHIQPWLRLMDTARARHVRDRGRHEPSTG